MTLSIAMDDCIVITSTADDIIIHFPLRIISHTTSSYLEDYYIQNKYNNSGDISFTPPPHEGTVV